MINQYLNYMEILKKVKKIKFKLKMEDLDFKHCFEFLEEIKNHLEKENMLNIENINIRNQLNKLKEVHNDILNSKSWLLAKKLQSIKANLKKLIGKK